MDKERLKKILDFNENHRNAIINATREFYEYIGRQNPTVISDIQTMAQLLFAQRGYKFLRIPMKSKEIKAFQLKLNESKYVVLNTSMSLANNNFAIAHELYHVLIQKDDNLAISGEVYLNNYDENEGELMANAFAGAILMPTEDVKLFVGLLDRKNPLLEEISSKYPHIYEQLTVFSMMSYFQTTYMSVVIRCYELGIFNVLDSELMDTLLNDNKDERQKRLFERMPQKSGNISIMEATGEDDFEKLFEEAKIIGNDNVENGLLSKEDLEYRLQGMKNAYLYVKEGEL